MKLICDSQDSERRRVPESHIPPRILRKVADADASTTILGQKEQDPGLHLACVRCRLHSATIELIPPEPWRSSAIPTERST